MSQEFRTVCWNAVQVAPPIDVIAQSSRSYAALYMQAQEQDDVD